ncbi:MAG: response regulator transcription factor [Deltaproteobacteria bacterium]|nr:response regulator transcription factor [Deltaproteobacteria bacterium]
MTADVPPAEPGGAIRLLVCEDDPRVRAGLERGLGAAGLTVVGAVDTGEEACARVQAAPPDVLLLDLELPGMSGLDVIDRLGGRTTAEILVLTTFEDERKVYQAICGGAAGYLTKRSPIVRVAEAVRDVHAGGTVIDPSLARRFWNFFRSQEGRCPADPYGLTAEEIEVLALVGRGLTNPEVGRAVGRTRRAVKVDLERIYRKLGVRSRVDAVVKAVAAGLVQL